MLLRKCFGVIFFLYLQIIKTSCEEGGSLAFAIDDTWSMQDDIKYVKEGAQAIMNLVLAKKSDIKELVLVTFNDPDVELRTKNTSQNTFLNDLQSIKPHGGDDCPEMALTGIKTALKASGPGSYIYAFTDANAKDYHKIKKIQSLCQKKQSQVVIVYSQDRYCYDPQGDDFTVYYDIAKACSGQVFIVPKDQVKSVLTTIETLLHGKNSIFQWIMVPRTKSYVSVKFTIDEKAEYAIVSTSGTNVDLLITKDSNWSHRQVNYEKTMWNVNGKVVKLIDPRPGTYYAWVRGESAISVVIYGRTDFTFQHGFSNLEPKSLKYTTKQPIAGAKQYVSINVTDPDNSVNIQTAHILDIKNNIIKELSLREIGKNFYITKAFVSPQYTFRIAVLGETKATHKTISRTSKNIDPLIVDPIPESIPVVKIEEGKELDVNYGSGVILTCKVTAHPTPKIEWYTSSGRLLISQSSVIDDPLFVSYLKLENIKQNENYICKASNKLIGSVRESRIQVNVRPVFTIIGKEVYNAKYGEDVKIPCNIKSYLPIQIKWYRSGKQLSDSPGKHSISLDGSELTLTSMDINMQGKYTCEATLTSDPKIKKTHDRDVKIPGLAHPKVTFVKSFWEGKDFTAICRVEGVPKPIISWQFKPKGSKTFSTISGPSGEELHIPGMRLKDTGVYKCTAKNVIDVAEHDFIVNVEEHPIIHNKHRNYYGVEGDLVMKIICNVTGFPEPTILWTKKGQPIQMDQKHNVQGATLIINHPAISDSAEYKCEAKNRLGEDEITFVVDIVDNFEGEDNFNGRTHEVFVEYGKSETIKCNLKHVGEGSVRWYRDGILEKQTGSTYTIETASISDEGNYTCRVNTDEGSTSETNVVYVGNSPIFEDDSPSPITIDWKKNDQKLDCAAEAEPPARYEWTHNGKTVETGKGLGDKLTITDWGEYTCNVKNVLGTIQKTFKVVTTGCYITKDIVTQNQPLVTKIDKPVWPLSTGNSGILLKENEEIKLSCPDVYLNTKKITTNTFKILPTKNEVTAKCITQDKFTVDNKVYSYSELQCNAKVEPSIYGRRKQCAGTNSEKLAVGFGVNGFLEAYDVCYDTNLNVPLYASASNQISSQSDGVDLAKFVWSSTLEQSNVKAGSLKNCYTKGQLVNVNEVGLGPAQAATFKDDLNSVLIWNPSCDHSSRTSWQTFNDMTRGMTLSGKLSSWTGASGYAPKAFGLVPRYLWKVINFEEVSTVTVYVNDKSAVDSDVRCSGACEQVIEPEKFLYCCTLDEFSKNFGVPLDTFKAV